MAAMMPECMLQNIAHTQRNPSHGENASRRNTYTPPLRGYAVPSSATMSAPHSVSSPPSAHTRNTPATERTWPVIRDGCTKIDAPRMVPTTMDVERTRPRERFSSGVGEGAKTGGMGPVCYDRCRGNTSGCMRPGPRHLLGHLHSGPPMRSLSATLLLLTLPIALPAQGGGSPLDAFRNNIAAIHTRNRAAYLSVYLHTPALARVGPDGLQQGYDAFARGAGAGWPDTLIATHLRVVPLTPDVAFGVYRYRVVDSSGGSA